jgi:hypothetical protein
MGWELVLVLVALIALAGCQGISAASKQTKTTPPPASEQHGFADG